MTTDIFNLSPYYHIDPTETSARAFDLIKFLYDVKDLPDYQKRELGKDIKTEDDAEWVSDIVYTTKTTADNFMMVAPILLYRIVETHLKKYLLILYKTSLANPSPHKRKGNVLNFERAIMTADIVRIIELYKNSTAATDISHLPAYDIITELRALNNALKHNHDYVSDELTAINPIWVTDELIVVDQIQSRIQAFDAGIGTFSHNLGQKIRPHF